MDFFQSVDLKHGETNKGKQRYKCSNWLHCGKTFSELGEKKVSFIKCPGCGKVIEGLKYGKVWHVDKQGDIKQRYKCSGRGVVAVNYVRTEERGQ